MRLTLTPKDLHFKPIEISVDVFLQGQGICNRISKHIFPSTFPKGKAKYIRIACLLGRTNTPRYDCMNLNKYITKINGKETISMVQTFHEIKEEICRSLLQNIFNYMFLFLLGILFCKSLLWFIAGK